MRALVVRGVVDSTVAAIVVNATHKNIVWNKNFLITY